MRRDFIANAAHELRTPLTNLQGYLEALRDGVIAADRATYDSLWDEAERLVRLSRSLDALAEGDAGDEPAEPVEELDLAAAIRTALELAQPTLERAGLRLVVDVPDAPAGARQPGPARPGPRQPPVRTRRATRRPAARSRSAPSVDRPISSSRSRTPATGIPPSRPRPRLRALLPGREVARPGARRRRHRPGHRQAARRGGRRPGRRRVGRRARRGSGSASRPDRAPGDVTERRCSTDPE